MEVASGKIYCILCKRELYTDFERKKGQHWECHAEMLDFNEDERKAIEEYSKLFKIVKDNSKRELHLDINLYLQKGIPMREISDAFHEVILICNNRWYALDNGFEGEYPIEKFGYQPLRPAHVQLYRPYRHSSGYDTWIPRPDWLLDIAWFGNSIHKHEWVEFINVTISKYYYIMVTGFILDSQKGHIKEVQPIANGVWLPIINLEYAYAEQKNIIFLSKPFTVAPENNLTIKIMLDTDITVSEKFGLIGFAIGQRRALIDEKGQG